MARHEKVRHTESSDVPVFHSPSGWRGRVVLVLLLLVLADIFLGVQRAGQIASALPPQAARYNTSVDYPQVIARRTAACAKKAGEYDEDGTLQVPLIGDGGVFQRVVQIVTRGSASYGVDPFTGRVVYQLTQLEQHATRSCRFAVEQFGQVPARTIVLTYDDGPGPVWTPKILDVLDAYGVKATFFTIGNNILAYQPVFRRLVADGQDIGNHTLTHPELAKLSPAAARRELVANAHIIAYVGHVSTRIFRTPYGGGDRRSIEKNIGATAVAQQDGDTEVGMNKISADYAAKPGDVLPVPGFNGAGILELMHDGGGKNRFQTLQLTIRIVRQGLAHGYRFITVAQLLSHQPGFQVQPQRQIQPTLADDLGFWQVWGPHVVLQNLVGWTMLASTAFIGLMLIIMTGVALFSRWYRYRDIPDWHPDLVSVVIAALQEAKVIRNTIETIFSFEYQFPLQIVVVDDGSKDRDPADRTWAILQEMAAEYREKADAKRQLHVYTHRNGGKASALNHAYLDAAVQGGAVRGQVAVQIDSDTRVKRQTIPRLVRHFSDNRVGMVTGRITPDNFGSTLLSKMLGHFQATEFAVGVALPRECQNFFRAVQIASGAVCAVRPKLVRTMGGYASDTAAEDAEFAIRCHKFGYLVIQDLTATVVTEVPQTIRALKSQWKRWEFGICQAIYKHRDVLVHARYGMLVPVMWYAALSTLIPTLVLPFMYFRFAQAVVAGNWRMVVIYPLVFTCYRFMMCVFAMVVLREWSWNPFTATYYRFVNDPLRVYLAYVTWHAMITGKIIGWNGTRVKRQGAGPMATQAASATREAREPANA